MGEGPRLPNHVYQQVSVRILNWLGSKYGQVAERTSPSVHGELRFSSLPMKHPDDSGPAASESRLKGTDVCSYMEEFYDTLVHALHSDEPNYQYTSRPEDDFDPLGFGQVLDLYPSSPCLSHHCTDSSCHCSH